MVAQTYNPSAYEERQEESKFKASLGWLGSHCLKKTKTKPNQPKSSSQMAQWVDVLAMQAW